MDPVNVLGSKVGQLVIGHNVVQGGICGEKTTALTMLFIMRAVLTENVVGNARDTLVHHFANVQIIDRLD